MIIGKTTGLLLDGRPMAACDNVIIIGYANDVYLNRVYDGNNYNEMNSLLKALYNNDMKCYCLTVESFNELKAKYISLRQLGKLPQAKPIVIQRKNITIAENNPNIKKYIKEKLAEGVYLLNIPQNSEVKTFIKESGLDFLGKIQQAEQDYEFITFPTIPLFLYGLIFLKKYFY